ncbi:Nucleotidylyl transferase [Rhodotorula sp. JG-1b]|nr:Nucleotidylyl transferase [Rhodotorula sp. JG-1b]
MPVKLPLPTSSPANIRSLLPTSSTSGGCTLVYASHARWPLPRQSTSESPKALLQISVVDSSFNPPHAAHLALAQHGRHDAHLLALTIANPDKGSIDEDAVTTRLEMMRAVAKDLERRAAAPDGKPEWGNVAVAVLQAPTFVQKSEMLRKDLDALAQAQAENESVSVRLTFGVGYDTLIRIFAPRYYQPPNPGLHTSMEALLARDDSRIACARRGDVSPADERAFLTSDEVREWAERGKIDMFDIPDTQVQGISSTAIRAAAGEGRWDDVTRSVPIPEVVEIMRSKQLYRREDR